MASVSSARKVAELVHWWLGAKFDQKKLQLSSEPTILGVTYNLKLMQLEIKEERRVDLLEEIDSILQSGLLDPGSAGKLKGKLMFGASQLWGKVGRAFLRPISERQYWKFPASSEFKLDMQLVESLKQWRKLIDASPPRPIDLAHERRADVVIFTDGFTPGPRSSDRSPDRIGGVLFDRWLRSPRQFTAVVPDKIKARWLERVTQIMPIEMLAPVVALATFADRVFEPNLILPIDSASVEAALVKGYSSREDMCEIISLFWETGLSLSVRVFIDRIATDANPADWPSRNNLCKGEAAGWSAIRARWPSACKLKSWGPGLFDCSHFSFWVYLAASRLWPVKLCVWVFVLVRLTHLLELKTLVRHQNYQSDCSTHALCSLKSAPARFRDCWHVARFACGFYFKD